VLDDDKRRALTDFYREEFDRHLAHLQMSGIINEDNETMRRTCHKLMAQLDLLCGRDEFPAVAETLLQNFETLTRLSALDSRRAH
jgi:hypothetical protein